MKRSDENQSVLVYAYGCGEPIDGIPHAISERTRQRDMWDQLVRADRAAERAQEAAARTVPEIDGLLSEIARLTASIEDAVTARRAARAKARAKVDTPTIDAQIAALADARRAARQTLWPLMGVWRKEHKDDIKTIEDQRRATAKAIRQQSGLYWGNYNRVADAFDRARKLARKAGGRPRWSDRERTDLVLTVQIQRTTTGLGASMAELMSGRFHPLQISPVDPRAFDQSVSRGERGRLARTTVDMRVDAAGHRIVLPVTIHRLPPPETRIKSAQLTCHQEGERTRWQLALTGTTTATRPAHASPAAVGVDLGWRLEPDGSLLVATLFDGTRLSRYHLPAAWMRGQDQVERLASYIDDAVLELAQSYHERVADLPDDLRTPLMAWRPRLGARHVNVQALHDAVRSRIDAVKSCPASADVPTDIRAWYDRYRHLALWRDNLRAKLQRQRREIYRLAAREIATGYAMIGLEDMDLSKMARTKRRDPEDPDNPLFAQARAQRVRAAVHLFRLEVAHQAAKRGAEIVSIEGPSTMRCGECGQETGQADRAARVWTCRHCDAAWDQDANASRNLYLAAVGAPTGLVVSRAA